MPGDERGVSAPAEGHQVPGVGGHLAAEHHAGVENITAHLELKVKIII